VPSQKNKIYQYVREQTFQFYGSETVIHEYHSSIQLLELGITGDAQAVMRSFSLFQTNYYTVGFDNSVVKGDPHSHLSANKVVILFLHLNHDMASPGCTRK
jgi:hypothetical protein